MHPSQALFQDHIQPVLLPVCDHYAGSEKLMRKSMQLQEQLGPLFDITFDCEDGAASGNEAQHARLVAELINSEHNRHRRIGVRVHDLRHPAFEQDLSLILPAAAERLAYLVLPKIDTADQIRKALQRINFYAEMGGRKNLPVHVLIESHEALADVMAIAAIPQVECLSFGIMDFVSAHFGAIPAQAMRSPGQFQHPLIVRAKAKIAAACHRYGKVPSHNVTTEIADRNVARQDAQRARDELGYTRMWSIHPNQITDIIAVMAPGQDEIMTAAQILKSAQDNQWGPIQFNGHLHDRASYRYYWTILKRAKMSAITLPPLAQEILEGDHT
ncbi:HpcH/HpaI aldolase/citrate lyase family protein [Undibacterium griseum]|uniref:CoA ester lyase n=1 Tax=Undibacterium griseum TaxID=2762295 RepID=A0ABR6YLW5_9BURK|nr:aldolase/citrate lyase family protein [Undibacterium griseum]MBC3884899.1 CoA ester lyase [Undibacterium griseum]